MYISSPSVLRPKLPGLAIGLAICLISFSNSVAVGQGLDATKTRYSLPLPEAPTIDGIIDADESWVWAGGAAGNNWRITIDDDLEDFIRGGQIGDGGGSAPADNEDLSFNIFAGHDSENLYIAAQIMDFDIGEDSAEFESENGQTWLDDSVEVFIDGDNSNFPERDTTGMNPEVVDTGGQYVITINNAFRQAEAGNPGYGPNEAWYARAELTDTGWDAEFRISLDAIGNPQPGDVIGFDIAVNDDDDDGPAERQVIWSGSPHVEATYGNLVLGGKNYTAPRTTTAPTIDGVIDPDEYAGAQAEVVNGNTGVYNIPSGDDTWEEGDSSYTYWVTHDDDAVYVGVDVVDDEIFTDSADAGSEDGQTWVDDSIEIFFDPDDSNDSGRGDKEFEGQYVLTANGAWRDNEANNPQFGENDDWYAVTSETEDGYAVEFRVNKSALLDPEDGDMLGWNVALNDDDGSGRKLQLNWNGRPHSEFTYGFLTLGEGLVDVCDPNASADLNGNGTVDFPDFLILSGNFNMEVSSHADGDLNCNGTVDFPDFLALSASFGSETAAAQSVPEPSGFVTLCLGGMLVGYLRPRRRRK